MKDTVLDMKDSFSKHDDGCYAKGRGDMKPKEVHYKEYEDLEIIPQDELDQKNIELEKHLVENNKEEEQ